MDVLQIHRKSGSYKVKLFEGVLRDLSVNAFKAIIGMGVRDLDTFLYLSPQGLPNISKKIIEEIKIAQQSVHKQLKVSGKSFLKAEKINRESKKVRKIKSDNKKKPKNDIITNSKVIEAKERILKNALKKLSTRARRIIKEHRMGSFERFMGINSKKIAKIKEIDTSTANEIFQAQNDIINQLADKKKISLFKFNSKELAYFDNLISSFKPIIIEKSTGEECQSEAINDKKKSKKIKKKDSKSSFFKISIDEEYYQRSLGHGLDYPASWSVIVRSIPDLFILDDETKDYLWDKAGKSSLSSLEITPEEWEDLESVAIFNNYQMDILLGVSIDYFISSGIKKDTFDKILKTINELIESSSDSQRYKPISYVSDNQIISYQEVMTIYDFRIDSFNIPDDLVKSLMNRGIEKWGELTRFSEKAIIEQDGSTFSVYQFIHNLWRMRYYASLTTLRLSDFPLETYTSFQKMIEAYIDLSVRKPRDREIIHGRMGMLEGRLWTLNELAKVYGLSRQRVQQIENKHFKKLSHHVRINKLDRFWITTHEILQMAGGACELDELNKRISSNLGWNDKPNNSSLIPLLELKGNLRIDNNTKIVTISDWKCLSCPNVLKSLQEVFSTNKNERPVTEIRDYLISICKLNCEFECYKPALVFSAGFMHLLVKRTDDLIIEDSVIFSSDTWGSRRGSYTQLAERIVKQAGKAMHFSEVYKIVVKTLPEGNDITERNVHTWLTHSNRTLLWDRGTFIHCDCIHIPGSLIERIEEWVVDKLEAGAPFIEVSGVYDKFRTDCDDRGITSETALYTCLRRVGTTQLCYPRYPQIYLSEGYESRMPVVVALEQFIHDSGNSVSYVNLKQYALHDLCIKPFKFHQFLNDSSHIIRTKSGDIVNINNFILDKQKFSNLKEYIRSILIKEDHISVNKVFKEKRVTCKMLGIDDPKILYQLLKSDSFKDFDLTSYPQVSRAKSDSQLTKDRGIISQVVEFIKHKKGPCSFEELESHFVDRLGYNENTVYAVTYKDEIFRLTKGTYIHKDTIEWTDEKQIMLEVQALDTYTHAIRAGRFYAFINHLLEYNSLPELENNIIWTQSLLCDLLTQNGKFKILGNTQNIYVSIPNEHKIQSFEDLLYRILRDIYDGAANLDVFEEDMRKAGVIKNRITSGLLGDQKKVCTNNRLIMLKELSKGA